MKAGRPASVTTVDAFVAALDHPLKAEIEALRRLMAATDPTIQEELKWNSVTFRTTESFATVNLRSTDRLQIILHLGAKVRKNLPKLELADPAGLVKWLAPDRCLVSLAPGAGTKAQRAVLQSMVRKWISYV